MKNSEQLNSTYRKLREDLTASIVGELKKAEGNKVVFDSAWEDAPGNDIVEVNLEEGVCFRDAMGAPDTNSYPIKDLGIEDALYILGVLEEKS